MTSPTSTLASRASANRAFSLVELLVVIGIVVVLVTLTLVVISRATGAGATFRLQGQISALVVGLDAYKTEFGDVPRYDGAASATNNGAVLLARAMTGHLDAAADGNAGPGFKVANRTGSLGGKVYGPYIELSQFRISTETDPLERTLLDRNNRPILYFPALKSPANVKQLLNGQPSYVGPRISGRQTTLISSSDAPASTITDANLRYFLGDYNGNGFIDGVDERLMNADYLVLGSGNDGAFGQVTGTPWPASPEARKAYRSKIDDVTNID